MTQYMLYFSLSLAYSSVPCSLWQIKPSPYELNDMIIFINTKKTY